LQSLLSPPRKIVAKEFSLYLKANGNFAISDSLFVRSAITAEGGQPRNHTGVCTDEFRQLTY
jgi:hypothetical protein